MKRLKTPLFALTLLSLCFFGGSCVFLSIRPERMETSKKYTYTWCSARVHLHDGSVVVFPRGFRMTKGVIKGEEGVRYDLLRNRVGRVQSVSCDSVACLQVYKDKILARSAVGVVAVPTYFFTLFVAAMSHWDDHVRGTR